MESIEEKSYSTKEFRFSVRKEAVDFIKDEYGKGKRLMHVERGGRLIHMKCSFRDCSFNIFCLKGREQNSCFEIVHASTNLSHTVAPTTDNNFNGFCGGVTKIGTVIISI